MSPKAESKVRTGRTASTPGANGKPQVTVGHFSRDSNIHYFGVCASEHLQSEKLISPLDYIGYCF